MPNAKNIIKASENEEGKVVIRLYGQEYDITSKVKDGTAKIKLYGQEYEVAVATKKPKVAKKQPAKKPAKKIKVVQKSKTEKLGLKFIKTPIKK